MNLALNGLLANQSHALCDQLIPISATKISKRDEICTVSHPTI